MKDERSTLELRLNTLENEKKFEAIKFEQMENECSLLRNELVKNEQLQPIIARLQVRRDAFSFSVSHPLVDLQELAEQTKEKTQLMFEAKIHDLTRENEQLKQRAEQLERQVELIERTHQTRLDEVSQNLQEEKVQHQQTKTKHLSEKERADQLQRQVKTKNSSKKKSFVSRV